VKIAESLSALAALIQQGTDDYHAWEEASRQIDRTQRLVESERKRAVELHQLITMDDFRDLLSDNTSDIF
jgi:predicted AAA+ superfamily ATPase